MSVNRSEKFTIALVALAHGNSHVMQMTLPPLFVLMQAEFGVSFAQLGLIITLLYASSGLTQPPAGFLADRIGAHRLIIGGTLLLSGAITTYALVPAYWMLIPLAILAGIGNSVFHPADLSVLSHRIPQARLGRAYAVHGVSGILGYAMIPLVATALGLYGGWRFALICIGLTGVTLGIVLALCRSLLVCGTAKAKSENAPAPAGSALAALARPVILASFAFFALTACGSIGLQIFSVPAMTTGYGLTLGLASTVLTVYLVATAVGLLAGGLIAERAQNHAGVTSRGLAMVAVCMGLMAVFADHVWVALPAMALAGFCYGAVQPSRDMLVRRAADEQRLGGTFGVVYTGFDLGSLSAPLIAGVLLDHGLPQGVFLAAAVLFGLAVLVVALGIRGRVPAAVARATAAD